MAGWGDGHSSGSQWVQSVVWFDVLWVCYQTDRWTNRKHVRAGTSHVLIWNSGTINDVIPDILGRRRWFEVLAGNNVGCHICRDLSGPG